MTSVREAAFELLRERGMTTIFGNPGSTELAMLGPLPDDFRYVLGLQEAVAVGMADGFAQASGNVAHVNLHTAPGVGNGVGAIFNARANKAPLLVTAGQQARSLITMQANLTNRDAVEVPRPYVKWSYEPPRAADVPFALAQAIHHASLPPTGPAFVSIPMDDWAREIEPVDYATQIARSVERPRAARRSADRGARRSGCARPRAPCSSRAPTSTPAAAGTPRSSSSSPSACRSGRLRRPAADASAFPRTIPPSRACCRRRSGRWRRRSPATTWCSSPAPRCSRTTRTFPATSCRGRRARRDHERPRRGRARADGRCDRRRRRADAARARTTSSASRPTRRAPLGRRRDQPRSRRRRQRRAALGRGGARDARRAVSRRTASSCSSRRRAPPRCATSCGSRDPAPTTSAPAAGSASGSPRALGVQLAEPQRQVVCVLGEGSAQYAITAFWTAAAYSMPVKFLVLRNNEYSILKWFADARERHRRARRSTCRGSTSRRPRAATACPSRRSAGASELHDGARAMRSRRTARGSSRSTSRPAWRCA